MVFEAAEATNRHGFGLKAATVTPEGAGDVGSPNALLREAIGGKVIIRTGRRLSGVRPIGGIHAPISIVRMAVDDAYNAREYREMEGDDEIAWRVERISRRTCRAVAEFSFQQARRMHATVFGGPKWTVSPVYEGMLKEELDAAAARHPDVRYRPLLIDALYAALISHSGDALVVPALNRDGDCLSDMVLQLFGSIAGAESQLLAFDDDFRASAVMAEAPHGTAPTLQGKNVANPLAMILAGASVLPYMGGVRAPVASRAIYEGALEAIAEDVRTADLGGQRAAPTSSPTRSSSASAPSSTSGRRWGRAPSATEPPRGSLAPVAHHDQDDDERSKRATADPITSGTASPATLTRPPRRGPRRGNASRSSTVKRPLCIEATSP